MADLSEVEGEEHDEDTVTNAAKSFAGAGDNNGGGGGIEPTVQEGSVSSSNVAASVLTSSLLSLMCHETIKCPARATLHRSVARRP